MTSDCEVLAKTTESGCSVARRPVGFRPKPLEESEDVPVLGELRPVDGGLPIPLEKPSITVGQDRTCDVVIEHLSVAANHCQMEFREGHWHIEDLGSRGGICVNGEKVESAWVPSLSVINIGGVEFDLQYSTTCAKAKNHAAVAPELLSRLDRAIKAVPRPKSRRIQVRAGQANLSQFDRVPLAFLQPTNGGQPIPLLYEELYVGRDSDGDVVLPYPTIAKTHCLLRFQDGYWLVRDLNNNGVTINDEIMSEGWLPPGAVLGLGKNTFALKYTTSATTPPPQLPVPFNESDNRKEDSIEPVPTEHESVKRGLETAETDSVPDATNVDAAAVVDDEWDVDESALLNDEPAVPVPVPTDEPFRALDERLLALDEPASAPAPSTPVREPRRNANASRQSVVVTRQQLSVPPLKLARIAQLLKLRDCDGLLLTRPANIAWFTGGTEVPRRFDGEPAAALLMTSKGGSLLARQADSEELLKRVSSDVVLQRRDVAWPGVSREQLCEQSGVRKLASDQPLDGIADASSDVAALRLPLLPAEIEKVRKLGIRVARTIERAAREFARGDTEAQIAGDVASRLIRHDVVPVRVQVWGDGRGQGCQNWSFSRSAVNHECTIAVIARRYGLHVAVSRTVSFGVPSKERRWSFLDMLLAHGTALTNSRGRCEVSAVWGDVDRVSESLGETNSWRATDAGCITGYELCETPISQTSSRHLRAGMPVLWHTLIGTARAIDTVLVREADSKNITQTGEWPQTSVMVNDQPVCVQTMLQRAG